MLLDGHLQSFSPPPSPSLITLEVPSLRRFVPLLDLLDDEAAYAHTGANTKVPKGVSELRPTASVFIPSRPTAHPPSRDTSYANGLKARTSSIQATSTGRRPRGQVSIASPVPVRLTPKTSPFLDSERETITDISDLRGRKSYRLELSPSPPSSPSSSLSPSPSPPPSYRSSSALSLSSDSSGPSVRTRSRASTPEYHLGQQGRTREHTPPSSYWSRKAAPAQDDVEEFGDNIVLTSEKELDRLFKFDVRPFTPSRSDHGPLVRVDSPVLARTRTRNGITPTKQITLRDNDEDALTLVSRNPVLIDLTAEQDPPSPTPSSSLPIVLRHSSRPVLSPTAPSAEKPKERPRGKKQAKSPVTDGIRVKPLEADLLLDVPAETALNMGASDFSIEDIVRIGLQDLVDRGEIDHSEGEESSTGSEIPVKRKLRDIQSLRHKMGLIPATSTTSSSSNRSYGVESPYKVLASAPSARTTISGSLFNPTPSDKLQSSLMKAWAATEPTQGHKVYVSKLLKELTYIVNTRLGGPGSSNDPATRRFEVDVFGSVSWGGETGTSGDLDLVILDRQMPQGYHPSLWRVPSGEPLVNNGRGPRTPFRNLPRVYKLWDLAHTLGSVGMEGAQAIVNATTPIVKFKDNRQGRQMECDVNVNDLGGWYNSSLILHYCLLSPHVLRPMIHALKLWAAAFDLNDPSGSRGPATMSSYCLTLMAIGYLQDRGVLPNLQANVRSTIPSDPAKADNPDTIWVGWGKDQGIKAHVGFDKYPPPGWTNSQPDLTAAQALRQFFLFFSSASQGYGGFNYKTQLISILRGGIVRRAHEQGAEIRTEDTIRKQMKEAGHPMDAITAELNRSRNERMKEEAYMGKGDKGIQPRNWGERVIVVQDPFLWLKNCAGAMSKDGTSRFRAAIDLTHKLLSSSPEVTFEQVIHNPNPPPVRIRTPRSRPGGRGGGRGSPAPPKGSSRASTPGQRVRTPKPARD